jgi:bifunctional DNA-binding transcriptional regulator/antitoxin component of YhaV-PrlF toxin-antitoxin module
MAKAASLKTRASTKGQVVLPKAIRDKRGFGPGAESSINGSRAC